MDQSNNQKITPVYRKYPLSRIVSIREIVSADYVQGTYMGGKVHVHQEAWELCFCLEGEVTYFHGDREICLRPGQLIFTAPGVAHDSHISDPESMSFFISFTCSDTYMQLLRQRVVRINLSQQRLLEQLVDELRSAFELRNDRLRIWNFAPGHDSPLGAEQMICCYLEQLLIGSLRTLTAQSGSVTVAEALESDLVDRINSYINRHLHESITVEDLCRELHYGRSKIFSVYKKTTGTSINTYITQQRLERARQLLEKGNCTVTKVAEQVGFTSLQYFSRKFTEANGVTPSRYMELCRESEQI